MGYAALGSALAAAGALWLMGAYQPDGFAWSSRPAALVTIAVVGPVMLAVYFVLLKVLRVTELEDLLQPLLGRLRRTRGVAPAEAEDPATGPGSGTATGPGEALANEVPTPSGTAPQRATTSMDTGLIPRISGEFDTASFRMGPKIRDAEAPGSKPDGGYLPEEELASTAQASQGRTEIPLPGRRTYQGQIGHNPYFPFGRRTKK
jgi:putative peptidoglycan lipid II flippase